MDHAQEENVTGPEDEDTTKWGNPMEEFNAVIKTAQQNASGAKGAKNVNEQVTDSEVDTEVTTMEENELS